MLLQGRLQLHPDLPSVDLHTLVVMVTDRILELGTAITTDSYELQQQKQMQIDSVLKVIPRLQYGLDVNVVFSSVSAFEYTEELTIFDSLGIRLYHGWLIDPEHSDANLITGKSYNLLANELVEYHSQQAIIGTASVEPTGETSQLHVFFEPLTPSPHYPLDILNLYPPSTH